MDIRDELAALKIERDPRPTPWIGTDRGAAIIGIAAVLLFIVFIALMTRDDDEHADVLCQVGHQEWRHSSHGSSSKIWVCDRWEGR